MINKFHSYIWLAAIGVIITLISILILLIGWGKYLKNVRLLAKDDSYWKQPTKVKTNKSFKETNLLSQKIKIKKLSMVGFILLTIGVIITVIAFWLGI